MQTRQEIEDEYWKIVETAGAEKERKIKELEK